MGRFAFTVVYTYSGPHIQVKSIATGKTFNVQYTGAIGATVGDTVSVIIDNYNQWKTIINERTGSSATVSSVYNAY